MRAARTPSSATWHLLGDRGCGASPDGEAIEGSWAAVRDRVDRDEGSRCANCRWPPS
jgi:hypothetical protein